LGPLGDCEFPRCSRHHVFVNGYCENEFDVVKRLPHQTRKERQNVWNDPFLSDKSGLGLQRPWLVNHVNHATKPRLSSPVSRCDDRFAKLWIIVLSFQASVRQLFLPSCLSMQIAYCSCVCIVMKIEIVEEWVSGVLSIFNPVWGLSASCYRSSHLLLVKVWVLFFVQLRSFVFCLALLYLFVL